VRRVVEFFRPFLPAGSPPATVLLVCDAPAEGTEVTLATDAGGWGYSPAGIREVSIHLDGRAPGDNPERHAALGKVSASKRRLIPPKVSFVGFRVR
jgi:hypothetical protein